MKIIGLTGSIGSGKEVVKDILMKRFNCWYVHLSSLIKGELEKKKSNFDRKAMQDLGNELRKKYGSHILAKLAVDYMQGDKEMLIVDGIRNPGEVEYLRKKFGGNFVLIAVDAPQKLRFERIVKRTRSTDPKTWKEFVFLDERDQGKGEPAYGQQTVRCRDQADFVIFNDGSREKIESEVNDIVKKI